MSEQIQYKLFDGKEKGLTETYIGFGVVLQLNERKIDSEAKSYLEPKLVIYGYDRESDEKDDDCPLWCEGYQTADASRLFNMFVDEFTNHPYTSDYCKTINKKTITPTSRNVIEKYYRDGRWLCECLEDENFAVLMTEFVWWVQQTRENSGTYYRRFIYRQRDNEVTSITVPSYLNK